MAQKRDSANRNGPVRKTPDGRRIAAQRSVAAARGGTNRWLMVGAPIVAVVVVVAILVAVKAGSGSTKPKSGKAAAPASASVAATVTSVPASVLDTIGLGGVSTPPKSISGAALTTGGKPEVLYIGAEWCPYCAAERWPLAVALSRFGSLTGLGEVTSSASDVYPNTATLTFHGASYTSTYLTLTAREIFSNQVVGSNYAPLDTLTSDQRSLFESVGGGAFPFLDIGGRYLFAASYNPAILKGLTQEQIANELSDPTSAVAKAIDGAANLITAAICSTTGNKPAAVCTSSGVTAAAAALPSSS